MLPKHALSFRVPKPAEKPIKPRDTSAIPLAPKTIGDHLMRVRLERKLTLKQVAAVIGVSFESVNFWERNLHYPTEWRRDRVVAFIGFDPELADQATQQQT